MIVAALIGAGIALAGYFIGRGLERAAMQLRIGAQVAIETWRKAGGLK